MRIQVLIYLLLLLLPYPVFAGALSVPPLNHGMVVSEQKLASQVGADILRAGGNAIDAAVAVGYALAVVNPCCGNIGGGGFMLIHLADGKNIFLNFREKAPLNASPNMYLDKNGKSIPNKSLKGYLAVAVPGTVLGLETALKKYGTMQRKEVMAPAIRLAQDGFLVTPYQEKLFTQFAPDFREQPNVAAIFLKKGAPFQAGDHLKQPDLARTLKLISERGSDAFYRGPIAAEIVAASKAHGGVLTLADFANYNVEELTPLSCNYHGYDFIVAPPPSSGGTTLCEMLNILENFPLSKMGFRSTQSIIYIIEAMRQGFLDRQMLGDPNFVKNPTQQLLRKSYAKQLSEKIRHPQSVEQHTERESMQTTHYSVLDRKGNAVSVTYTLDGWFGARVIAGNTGFFLNNEMDDFSAGPNVSNQYGLLQSKQNEIQPGKRPLSSMTPTFVLKKGQLFLITGSPGGPRIITSVLLSTLNVIDYGMPIQKAVDEPRFHYQVNPDVVFMEPFAFSFFTRLGLEQAGYHLLSDSPWSSVEAIQIDPKTHLIQGGRDIRRPDGAAISE